MQNNKKIIASDKDTFYNILNEQLEELIAKEPDWLADLANASAHLFTNLDDINWAGFYLIKDGELVLGPFQGKAACTRIKIGNGVCGTAVGEKMTQLVPDVHLFPGHIACDSASNSEIVVPIIKDDVVYGVLDIDSPYKERFNAKDQQHLEVFVKVLNHFIDWSKVLKGIPVNEL
jgi:GAF domain-containing protein